MLSRREMIAATAAASTAGLHPPLAFGGEDKIADARLGPPRTLNDYFPFAVPKTLPEWEARKAALREHLLVSLGLWPLPEKTPLAPVIHGKIEREGYTIEKVFFASMPGHYVSGSLYRPTGGSDSKRPAVLSPYGHWANGRFYEAPDKEAEKQVKAGAEKTREGAKFPLQARCAHLAKMGFVVFHHDMVGVADSTALPHREGFRDAAAELRLQNFMGLQTWNCIRALDFLCDLPNVDAKRVGVTGASGGGTQTFILCALDDRPAAAAPAVMVSTAMQGGCVCENCSYLRVGTGNVEFAAMTAPRPLALTGADDWTKEIMTKGYPELKKLYALYGKESNVTAKAWLQYGHNYNQPAREFVYSWFSKHLLGKDEAVSETPFKPVPPKELSVYDASHPRPADELRADKLRQTMTAASDARMAALAPTDARTLAEFRRVVGTALRVMVGGSLPDAVAVRKAPVETKPDGVTVHTAVLGRVGGTDAVPGVGLFGPKFDHTKAVVWAHPDGKASLFADGKLVPAARQLVDAGYAIVAPDVFGTGELKPAKPRDVNKEFAGYTFGYNRPPLAYQVQDLLTMLAFARTMLQVKALHLIGWGSVGPAAVLAKALAGDAVTKLAADVNKVRFEAVTDAADPLMLPGAVKYGGLGAFLALCAPGPVLAHNHAGTGTGKISAAAYAAAGAKDALRREAQPLPADKVLEWVLG